MKLARYNASSYGWSLGVIFDPFLYGVKICQRSWQSERGGRKNRINRPRKTVNSFVFSFDRSSVNITLLERDEVISRKCIGPQATGCLCVKVIRTL